MMQLSATFFGHVQGVGFRAAAHARARKLGLAGFVRNCADGSVELVAQGDKSKLQELVDELKTAFGTSRVDVQFSEAKDRFSGFTVRS